MWFARALLCFFLTAAGVALATAPSQDPEPDWQPALGYGGSPDCPEHTGTRNYRSDIVTRAKTKAVIYGRSVRKPTGCVKSAHLSITIGKKLRNLGLLDAGKSSYYIVDFSPSGSQMLLALNAESDDYRQYRDTSIAVLVLARGEIVWHNAWDLFGWKNCVAMVEPQGFLPDGRVIIRARKTVVAGDKSPNCVSDIGLYAVELNGSKVERLPDATKIHRYGKRSRPGFQACKSDPDIIGACFTIHGRLSAYNGTPTMRIWRIGTDRMLGVHDDIMPERLTLKMDWGVQAFGDYEVCPFKKQREGEMQIVCIENAKKVFFKDNR